MQRLYLSGMRNRVARVDENQQKIVGAMRKAGAYVLHLHTLKNAFDLLVVYRGKFIAVEVKNQKALPKKFTGLTESEKKSYLVSLLTDGEKRCMEAIESKGGMYEIVFSVQSALDLLQSL